MSSSEVALTIDDGPSASTLDLLSVLEAHGVLATFFFVTSNIALHGSERWVNRILNAGHQVASHSHSHAGPSVSADAYEYEIRTAANILVALGVSEPIQHRLPFGLLPEDLRGGRLDALDRLGIDSIGWSVDSEDWKLPAADDQAAAKRVALAIERGFSGHPSLPAIVLLHERPATVAALDRFLSGARLATRFVRVDQLNPDVALGRHTRCGYRAGSRTRAARRAPR